MNNFFKEFQDKIWQNISVITTQMVAFNFNSSDLIIKDMNTFVKLYKKSMCLLTITKLVVERFWTDRNAKIYLIYVQHHNSLDGLGINLKFQYTCQSDHIHIPDKLGLMYDVCLLFLLFSRPTHNNLKPKLCLS